MKAILLLSLMAATPLWQAPPSVAPQWVGAARAKAHVRRIVTVAPSVTETLFALGYEDRVVGVTRFDDRPERVKKLPKIGGFWDPNVEAVLALRPDLVIAAANVGARPALEQLSKLGVPVFVVPGDTLADAFHATRAIGGLMGAEGATRAARLTETMQTKLRQARTSSSAQTVLVVFSHDPLVVAGPQSLAGAALLVLGVNNAVGPGPRPYPHWSAEALLMAAPDVIIDATGQHGRGTKAPWAGLGSIPAVKNHRVRGLDLAVLLRPSPRIYEGIQALQEALRSPE